MSLEKQSTMDGVVVDENSTAATLSADPVTNKSGCQINRKLILLKAHYFLFYGGLTGVIVPLVLYCQELGMSISMVGILFGVLPFVQLISKPVCGSIADKFVKHKAVFTFNLVILTISLFSANFIPKLVQNVSTQHHVTWTPEDSAFVECFPGGPIQLRACDYMHDNDSTLSLQLLAPATVGCNLTCNIKEVEPIQRLFCATDHPDCLSRQRYSFYDTLDKRNHINLMVLIKPTDAKVQLTPHKLQTDLFCSTLAVSNISITDILFPSMHLHIATTARCPLDVHSLFGCPGVCMTTYNVSSTPTGQSVKTDSSLQLAWIWLACIIGWAAYGAVLSTSDTILMVTLGEKNRGDYGKTRLFTSAGWGIMSAISAYLIDVASAGKPQKDFTPGFYVFLILMILDILVTIPMRVPIFEKPTELANDVLILFKSPEVVLFAVAVFSVGITTGFLWTFLVVYANELNGTQLIVGLNYAVECLLSEIPFFAASGWIVKRIGYSNSMTFVLLVGAAKCIIYSMLSNAWYMLAVAPIHGVMYGLLYAALASYASLIAPAGTAATLQGIFQGIFEGAGVGVGSIIGGLVYARIGGRQTFLIFGLSTLVVCISNFVINCILNRVNRKSISLN